MKNKKKIKSGRQFTRIFTSVLFIVLLIGYTFAWNDVSQHKTNELKKNANVSYHDITLIEDYDEPDDPIPGVPYTKKAFVKNTGESGSGPVFVRLSLREYMDITPIRYIYSDQRFMIDKEGSFVVVAGDGLMSSAAVISLAQANYPELSITAANTPVFISKSVFPDMPPGAEEGWYFQTVYGDPNGQYGKFLLESVRTYDQDTTIQAPTYYTSYPTVQMNTGEKPADYDIDPVAYYHTGANPDSMNTITSDGTGTLYQYSSAGVLVNDNTDVGGPALNENKWSPIDWASGTNGDIRNYIVPGLGEIMSLSDWNSLLVIDPDNPPAVWVYDDNAGAPDDQYIYWSRPLEAGKSTKNIINTLTLKTQPDGAFWYGMHIDAQAVTPDELTDHNSDFTTGVWFDISQDVKDMLEFVPTKMIKATGITVTKAAAGAPGEPLPASQIEQTGAFEFTVTTIENTIFTTGLSVEVVGVRDRNLVLRPSSGSASVNPVKSGDIYTFSCAYMLTTSPGTAATVNYLIYADDTYLGAIFMRKVPPDIPVSIDAVEEKGGLELRSGGDGFPLQNLHLLPGYPTNVTLNHTGMGSLATGTEYNLKPVYTLSGTVNISKLTADAYLRSQTNLSLVGFTINERIPLSVTSSGSGTYTVGPLPFTLSGSSGPNGRTFTIEIDVKYNGLPLAGYEFKYNGGLVPGP